MFAMPPNAIESGSYVCASTLIALILPIVFGSWAFVPADEVAGGGDPAKASMATFLTAAFLIFLKATY